VFLQSLWRLIRFMSCFITNNCFDTNSSPDVINVKFSLCLTKHYAMRTYEGVDVETHPFGISRGECLASRPSCFTSCHRSRGTHWIEDWVATRVGLDDMENRKLYTTGAQTTTHCLPAHSESQYRLSYCGSLLTGLKKPPWSESASELY
jgi:hypothetical protein